VRGTDCLNVRATSPRASARSSDPRGPFTHYNVNCTENPPTHPAGRGGCRACCQTVCFRAWNTARSRRNARCSRSFPRSR
jgi:hypothetical protein